MAELKSLAELYQIGKNEVQGRRPTLTDWTEGSINDAYVGTAATLVQEAFRVVALEFAKTLLSSAEGTDLEFLATDHYGPDFARPMATKAIGIVTFSRPTSGAGNVLIPAGTIVKTAPNANGVAQSFVTVVDVTLTGLSTNVSIEAIVAGPEGNVDASTITIIESTLTDPTITVNNSDAPSGGLNELDDAAYREFIYAKIASLRGATKAAIEAQAKTVAGVVYASAVEFLSNVIEWDEANALPIGDSFLLPIARLYIGDANGVANDALIAAVLESISSVRAAGVMVQVLGAVAVPLNWSATITLNGAGPNFATLSVDATPIVNSMIEYIQDLPIGQNFNIATARAAILAIWGPAGSNDLTDFVSSTPTGNVAANANEKFIVGTVEVS
jgi:hypothetical protein